METIQYVNITHRNKDEAKKHLIAASPGGGKAHIVCTAQMSIPELVELHRRGMTWRRLPIIDGKMDTSLLYIDLDNDPKKKVPGHSQPVPDTDNPPPNITEDELKEMLWYACSPATPNGTTNYIDWDFTGSTSGKPYKYHVFVTLRDRVTTEDEYDLIMDDFEKRLEEAYKRLRKLEKSPVLRDINHYANAAVYAPSVERIEPIGVYKVKHIGMYFYTESPEPHTLAVITKKNERKRKDEKPSSEFREVPARWSGLARLLHREGAIDREIIENPGEDFNLAGCINFLRPGKTKETAQLKIGERDHSCYILTQALYGQARAYNKWMSANGLGEHKFSLEDIKRTLGKHLSRAYEIGDSFTHEKFIGQLYRMDKEFGAWSDDEYVERYRISVYKKKYARTQLDVIDSADRVIVEHMDGDRVVFSSTEERESILKENNVSISSLRRLAQAKGLTVVVERTSKRGRKNTVSLESLSAIGKINGSVFEYSGTLSTAERVWLHRNGYQVKKSKVAGGVHCAT